MSQVLFFADAHIHQHKKSTERLQHCIEALDWIFQTAISRDIQEIIFAGDLFHERQKIDVLSYQKTFEIFEKYCSKNRRITLLLGNHDLWHLQKLDISSVNPLRSIPGVTIVDRPSTLEYFGKYSVSFLPYTHNPIVDLKKIKNKSNFKLLVGHVAVDGAIWNTLHKTLAEVSVEHDGDMVKVGPEIFDEWDQVFLGHYHAEQRLQENVEYIGSPLQLSFGEAGQKKHIIAYDLETHKKEYILNEFSPKHYILPESDLDKYNLTDNFVRVLVDDISSSNLVEMRNELIREYNVASLEIQQSKFKEEDEHIIQDAKSILFKEDEMLERYIKEISKNSGLGDLDEQKLLKIGKEEICQYVPQ